VDPDPDSNPDPQHCLVYALICGTSSSLSHFPLFFFVQAVGPGFVYLLVVVVVGFGAVAMYMSRHQDRNKTPAESW
jgi:hypothetical protein